MGYFKELLDTLKGIRSSVWRLSRKPKLGKILLKGELMANVLGYEVDLLSVDDDDVVSQNIALTVDGVVTEEAILLPTDVMWAFSVPQDSSVSLSLTLVDDAGNASAPFVTETFVALDTIAPATPAGFGSIRLVSET